MKVYQKIYTLIIKYINNKQHIEPLNQYSGKPHKIKGFAVQGVQGQKERMVTFMFGKKKNKPIRVVHYEGIDAFATDYPCTLEVTDDELIIKRLKPETTVTLPLNRINSFSSMEEPRFMEQYHGEAKRTDKGTKKYYLVVQYDKGILAFWGTAMEWGRFNELQNMVLPNAPTSIEL